ncbi:hypoxia-inducible factor 1-alpha-like [Haliotis rufescens]|uniref:hypoxia-inducible factor 1-alpha-like n=1 Tax=Haliotis rufescens TaxID=6454 RepID=UPI00201FA057|nr:hypoxia-inducible factor 1-alpha-like [Haliotis rufescens]
MQCDAQLGDLPVQVKGRMEACSIENANSENDQAACSGTQKRLSRNKCEKMRRDRLQACIQQLACKVPLVAMYDKKLDKCNILRLTVAYLRMHIGLKKMKSHLNDWCPSFFSRENRGRLLHEIVDGFFLVVSQNGTIVFISTEITTVLGHNQFQLIGKSVYQILHPQDHKVFSAQFLPFSNRYGQSGHRSAYLRMLNLHTANAAKSEYSYVQLIGNLQQFSLLSKSRLSDNLNEKWLVSVCRIHRTRSIREISLIDINKTEWISQHHMTGEIFYQDPRSSWITGFLPSERLGYSPYNFLHHDDLEAVATSHLKIMKDDLVPQTIFRVKTASGTYIFVQSSSCVARDQWTKKAKFIVSLNQVLEQEEGQRKLALQKEEIDSTKAEKMFTDDILTMMSDTLIGSNDHTVHDDTCESANWQQSQYTTPFGNVIRSSVEKQPQNDTTMSATPSASTKPENSRKRAVDPFVRLIEESIMSEADMSRVNVTALSPDGHGKVNCCPRVGGSRPPGLDTISKGDNHSQMSSPKGCCSSERPAGSMLKLLLTDHADKAPMPVLKSSRVLAPVCESGLSPRTSMEASTPDPRVTPSPRHQNNESPMSEMSVGTDIASPSKSSTVSDQENMSPESPGSAAMKALPNFVRNFTEQLKRKHMLMQRSLLEQEAVIAMLESELKKVQEVGHCSATFQKICERLHSIKASKAKQQAELQCLQDKLNHQKRFSPSTPQMTSPEGTPQQTTVPETDVPQCTLGHMTFPRAQSTASATMTQVDLGEIEPTFYPTMMDASSEGSHSSGTSYRFSDKGSRQFPRTSFTDSSPNSLRQSPNHSIQESSMMTSPQGSLAPSPSSTYSQSSMNSASFTASSPSTRIHSPSQSSRSMSVLQSNVPHPGSNFSPTSHTHQLPIAQRNHHNRDSVPPSPHHQQLSPLPSLSNVYSQPVLDYSHRVDSLVSNPSWDTSPPAMSSHTSTQPHNQQMPLPSPTVGTMDHDSLSTRIIDGNRTVSRAERIKIIKSAYAKLPLHSFFPTYNNVPQSQLQDNLFTS